MSRLANRVARVEKARRGTDGLCVIRLPSPMSEAERKAYVATESARRGVTERATVVVVNRWVSETGGNNA